MNLCISNVQTFADEPVQGMPKILNCTNVWNNTSEQKIYKTWEWLQISGLVVGLIGLISNLVVSVVLIQSSKGKVYAQRYLLSFTLGNIINSLAAIPLYSTWDIEDQHSFSCKSFVWLFYSGYFIYVQSLTLMAVERFCAIKFAIHYKRLTSQKNVRIHLAFVWSTSLMLTIYPTIGYEVIEIQESSEISYECLGSEGLWIYDLVLDIFMPAALLTGFTMATIVLLKKRSVVSVTRSVRNNRVMKQSCLKLSFMVTMFVLYFGVYSVRNVMIEVGPEYYDDNYNTILFIDNLVYLLAFAFTWMNPIMNFVCDVRFRAILTGWIRCKRRKNQASSLTPVYAIRT